MSSNLQGAADVMGVIARKQGERFVITSDRTADEGPKHRAPKNRPMDVYQVWTGAQWSTEPAEAATFPTLDGADEYVRAHYARVMK
jgi:hypothetical protein